MDELIAQIMEKTGVTADKAKEMLGVTADWMKNRLPDEVADQVGSVLSSAGTVAGNATEAASGAAAAASGKVGDLWNTTRDTVSGLVQNDDQ